MSCGVPLRRSLSLLAAVGGATAAVTASTGRLPTATTLVPKASAYAASAAVTINPSSSHIRSSGRRGQLTGSASGKICVCRQGALQSNQFNHF